MLKNEILKLKAVYHNIIVIHVLDRVTYIMLHSGSGWLSELGSWIT